MMETVTYRGWEHCLRLCNAEIEVIIPAAIGPRVIHAGFIGCDNEFYVDPEQAGRSGGEEWLLFGGHRLWHAPESLPRTYQHENAPVIFTERGVFTRVTGPIEAATGLQKEMDIRVDERENRVEIIHRLINHTLWGIQCAPWGVTMMAPGGTCVVPLPPRGQHDDNLLPSSSIALWAYTDMSDPRFHWGRQFILIDHDPALSSQQKIGAYVPDGWVAYARADHLFVTRFAVDPLETYPDRNSPVDVYVDGTILEVETLAPLAVIPPGGAAEWPILWDFYRGSVVPRSDDDVIRDLLPLIRP
jgi:hypothetical protein